MRKKLNGRVLAGLAILSVVLLVALLAPVLAPHDPYELGVKRPYAITLCRRLPIVVRAPLEASVTLLEATTPVKLPTIQCPPN